MCDKKATAVARTVAITVAIMSTITIPVSTSTISISTTITPHIASTLCTAFSMLLTPLSGHGEHLCRQIIIHVVSRGSDHTPTITTITTITTRATSSGTTLLRRYRRHRVRR